jgi:MmyB-like transcription regulator ligand binding domain
VRRPIHKRVSLPEAGPLEFDCHVLHIPDSDQRLVIYSAEPGSATAHAFRRPGAANTTAGISAAGAGISAAAG